jgi:TonB family protein
MRSYFFLLIIASINNFAFAAPRDNEEPMTLNDAVQRHLLVTAALPKYPEIYQRQPGEETLINDGIFDLRFDYDTGRLREIHVVKSTGNSKLDGRAILAFKVWKAKPRSIHTLRVPITFKKPGRFNYY